nr:MAG TPA: hypothetical protein [Caudoviricetes sp.]
MQYLFQLLIFQTLVYNYQFLHLFQHPGNNLLSHNL